MIPDRDSTLQRILDSTPALIHTGLPDGHLDFFNETWLHYVGRSLADLEGWKWTASIHPDDLEAMLRAWRAALASGDPFLHEARVRRADGEFRWMLHHKIALRDERAKIVKWYGSSIDIEDRKRAERAQRESEERYRALIEVSPQIIWMTRPDGFNTYFNQWWYDYTELTQAESEGFGWVRVVHPEHRDRSIALWQHHVVSGSEFTMEMPVRRADGQYRWHLARGIPIRDTDGRIVRWMGVAIDIQDWKETEEALRRREEWLSEAQRLSHTGSWARNLHTNEMVYVSQELLQIAGFDREEGITPAEVLIRRVHPEDRLRAVEETQRAIRGKTDSVGERRLLFPDGTIRHIQFALHPVLDAAGHPVELIGTVMDVTDRKRAEEALRETQAALAHVTRVSTVGEVSASISHELNQPLAAIVNNASACLGLLSSAEPDLHEVRGALADIVGDAQRASAIIERVRAMASRSEPERVPVRLADLVREVAALVAAESNNRRVAIEIDVPEDLPPVLGDRVELHQVLLNLVVNGMDAMSGVDPAHRTLGIRGVSDQLDGHPAARIGVEDRGIGIRRDHADQLFEPFYTTKAHGMGLGLAISRSIIEAHGGRLWAEANPGPGATFSFALPAVATA